MQSQWGVDDQYAANAEASSAKELFTLEWLKLSENLVYSMSDTGGITLPAPIASSIVWLQGKPVQVAELNWKGWNTENIKSHTNTNSCWNFTGTENNLVLCFLGIVMIYTAIQNIEVRKIFKNWKFSFAIKITF